MVGITCSLAADPARQPFFQLLQLYLSDTKVSDTVITVIITGADYRYGHDASTVQSELSHFILFKFHIEIHCP